MSSTNDLSESTANVLSSASDGPKIKVLVCTANIGNQEPNVDSLSAWIPKDGATNLVLENQSYPVNANMKEKFKSMPQTYGNINEKTASKHGIVFLEFSLFL